MVVKYGASAQSVQSAQLVPFAHVAHLAPSAQSFPAGHCIPCDQFAQVFHLGQVGHCIPCIH